MFNDCEKACIYSFDGVFLAEVKVIDSDKDSMGLIFEEEDMDKVKTETVIVFYDGIQGLVTCKCSLSGRVKISGNESGEDSGSIYKVPCHIDELIGVDQRRQDLKVKVSFRIMLETQDETGENVKIPSKIKDISAGGVGLESKVNMNDGQYFVFSFDTDAGNTMLEGIVLWGKKISAENDTPVYRYGCRFCNMTSMKESMVRKFAFQEQLKRRKIQ